MAEDAARPSLFGMKLKSGYVDVVVKMKSPEPKSGRTSSRSNITDKKLVY